MKRLNSLILKISLNPITFVYLNVIIYFIALISYEYRIDIFFPSATLFLMFLFLFPLTIINSIFKNNLNSSIILTGYYWKVYALIILLANLLEYLYCGIPFLSLLGIGKHVIYAKYGLPLIHHISVSSWILVFIPFNKKRISFFVQLFSLANPLLIINRDILLLTLFCFIIKYILKNRKSHIFLYGCFAFCFLFGYIGNMRTGSAANNIILPFKENIKIKNDFLNWFFVYVTCSYFNFTNDFFSKCSYLQVPNINTFPEIIEWYRYFDLFGIFAFFLIIYSFLIYLKTKSKNKIDYFVLYVFLIYEALMTIFSKKIFITHTIYQFLVFFLIINMKKLKTLLKV